MDQIDNQPDINIGITETEDRPTALPPIPKFWTRILAGVIDGLILGLVGLCLGLLFVDYFVSIAGWGRLFGFVVAGLYFSIMNSRVFKGQTIGKRIMKIKVIDLEGEYITINKSTVRYIVFGSPYFLNGANLSGPLLLPPMSYAIGVIVFGGLLSLIYLYIFNRPTRRSLHDLVASSIVVNNAHFGPIKYEPIWKGHYAIIGSILLSIILFFSVGMQILWKHIQFEELVDLKNYIDNSSKYNAINVIAGQANHNGKNSTYLRVNVITFEKKTDYKQDSLNVASIVMNKYPDILGKDSLYIGIAYGYDIGIATYWNTYNSSFTKDDLKSFHDRKI